MVTCCNPLLRTINQAEHPAWVYNNNNNRWEDLALDSRGCFARMNSWRSVPTHSVAAMQELYQQLLPTKLYHQRKTGVGSGTSKVVYRMCGRLPENVLHVLAGCGIFAQTKYLARHNAALKIFFLFLQFWGTWNLFQKCLDGILKTETQTLVWEWAYESIMGCASLCRRHWGEGQQNQCQNSRQRAETSVSHWNELSLVG